MAQSGAHAMSGDRRPAVAGESARMRGKSVAKTLPAALVQLDREPASEARDEDRVRAVGEWAASDPLAALAYARQTFKGDRLAQALTAVFSAWARTAPEPAWRWLTANMPDQLQHLDTAIDQIGRRDPALAARLAADWARQHPDVGQELLTAALQGMTFAGHFSEAQEIVAALPLASEEERGALIDFLAGQWGRYQPTAAANWIASLPPGGLRDQAMTNLTGSWAEANPAEAADFAVHLPAGATRETALRQAIAGWLATDPESARAWVVKTNQHEDFDQAVQSIATDVNLIGREPDRALRWAATIFDDTLRAQSVSTILFNWYPRDPGAVVAYVKAAPNLTAEQKADLLSRLQAQK